MILTAARYYIYILSNHGRTVLYIGVTNDLRRRIAEHRVGVGSDFARWYNLRDLNYFEEYASPYEAIRREKQLKTWRREWKLDLIKKVNPTLKDPSDELPF